MEQATQDPVWTRLKKGLLQPTARTRYLYLKAGLGRMTCLMQTLRRGVPYRLNTQTFPNALDDKYEQETGVYGISYVISGRGRLLDTATGSHRLLEEGVFFQFNGIASKKLIVEPLDEISECSISVDQTTGGYLEGLKIWDSTLEGGKIGLQSGLFWKYNTLFELIQDQTKSSSDLILRLIDLLEAVYALYRIQDANHQFLERAVALLGQKMSPDFSVGDAAREMGIPEETFRRKFQSMMKVSPGKYHLQLRMDKALSLLTGESVRQVAERLGYTDPFLFSRQFKSHFGFPPSRVSRTNS